MTTLKLAIDASGARQGAREFETASEQVGRSAEKAGKAVDIYFGVGSVISKSIDEASSKTKNFAKTVEAVGEVTQVSQRVRLLGEEVRNLGSGMGSAASIGQTLSGALIDIAQISGKVEGGFSGFITLLRANPLLVAATVIGGIATAMSLFSGETGKANDELKKQIELQDQLRKTSVDLATQIQRNADLAQIGFGIDQQEQQYLRARRIAETASSLSGQPGFQSFADLQALTGLDEQQLRILSPRGGIQQQTQRFESNVQGTRIETTDVGLTNEAARRVLLLLAENIKINADILQPGVQGATGPLTQAEVQARQQPVGPPIGPGYMSPEQLSSYQMQFKPPTVLPNTDRLRQDAEELEKLNEKLREMKSLGQDVGSALGSAFFSIVNGAANARQALAGLLQQFVAIAQQRAIQGVANSLGNAFGASTTQKINNLQGGGSVNVPTVVGGGTSGGGLA